MKSYRDRIEHMSLLSFLKKRICRIYPTYFLCLIIALLVSVCLAEPIRWIKILPSFFMVQSWIPYKDVYFAGNSVSWYVSVSVFCYMFFPLLAKLVKKNSNVVVVVSVSIYLILCFLVPLEYEHALLYINPLFRTVDFVLGMWIYEILNRKIGQSINNRIVAMTKGGRLCCEMGSILLCLFFIIFSLRFHNALNYAVLWWVPSLTLIVIYYILDQNPGGVSKILQNKHLVILGSISYAFYLLHRSVLVINNYYMEINPINYVLDGLIVLTIIIFLAYIVTYYFDPLFTKKR